MISSSRDLVSLFIALELLSIPAYMLAAWRKRDVKSNEAGMKYFLLGVFASAVMLYGMSLLYGVTGSTLLSTIGEELDGSLTAQPIATLAIVFVIVGFAFKVSAVPFHSWAPDTYEGAPDTGDRVSVGGLEGRGLRRAAHARVRRVPRAERRVGAGVLGARRALDDRRQPRRAAPDEHDSHARLLVDRPGRFHPHAARGDRGERRGGSERAHGSDHLPRHLRGDEHRRLRRRHRRGPQDALGRDLVVRRVVLLRAGAVRGDDVLPLLPRGHAAARRLGRQVRRVPDAARRRRRMGDRACRHRCRQLGDRTLLLRRRRRRRCG